MTEKIPSSHRDLLDDESKAFAFLATLMLDHTPQVTPVWFNMAGDTLLINSSVGRVKDRNLRKDPNVAVAIMDLKHPNRYLQIRGVVSDITTDGAEDHIHQLSHKYNGRDFSIPEGQVRVKYAILIKHVFAS
ncbi:MAG: PPOX class F420-dependent oxidoreductase [Chloroflexi bacterium]|nr:PPOX class F420-dependent oxidoreductase [Chloroflexota bacterium]MQC26966.1 PPOX class F420-dependent oxidoreductase [Chloroflexota bacterium]